MVYGTGKVGATKAVEQILREKTTNVEVVSRDNAKKKDYTGIMVIDLVGTKKEATDQIAKALGAKVGDLPEGEAKPAADVLVIVGE